jgi:hypothetical protein
MMFAAFTVAGSGFLPPRLFDECIASAAALQAAWNCSIKYEANKPPATPASKPFIRSVSP